MDINIIINNIQTITAQLLNGGKEICSNNISTNVRYMKRHVKQEEQRLSLKDNNRKRYKTFLSRAFVSTAELANELISFEDKIIGIDFILYYTSETETIMITEFIWGEKRKEVFFHGSIPLPLEYIQDKSKFDLNWHIPKRKWQWNVFKKKT